MSTSDELPTSLFEAGLFSGLYSEPPLEGLSPVPCPCPELISGVESFGGVGGKLNRCELDVVETPEDPKDPEGCTVRGAVGLG